MPLPQSTGARRRSCRDRPAPRRIGGGTFAAERRAEADEQDPKGRVDRQRQARHAPVAADHVRERRHLRPATQYPSAEASERAADRWSERSAHRPLAVTPSRRVPKE